MAYPAAALAEWQNFYVIMGSAGAGLTGLQFVVMALIADLPMERDDGSASEAFATPTIVHFVAVLMLAASAVMPWHSLAPVAIAWGMGGVAGVVYTLIVLRRMLRQTVYKPVLEDWVFHLLLPLAAYGGLAVAAALVPWYTRASLFGLAGVSAVLLYTGIHNAWDNVTFLVVLKGKRTGK